MPEYELNFAIPRTIIQHILTTVNNQAILTVCYSGTFEKEVANKFFFPALLVSY